MLVDPAALIQQPVHAAVAVAAVALGESLAAFLVVGAFGHPTHTAVRSAAALAEIGEFSSILFPPGVDLGLRACR